MVLAIAVIFLVPTGNNPTTHHACGCALGYAEVLAGGTYKICRHNYSVGYEVVEGEGCKDVNECILWGVAELMCAAWTPPNAM